MQFVNHTASDNLMLKKGKEMDEANQEVLPVAEQPTSTEAAQPAVEETKEDKDEVK
jgi:hypothetical protein